MCRLNAKFALGQNVPYLFTNRIVGFILGETHAQSSSTHLCRGGTDKSPLGQKPTRTKAHWTISHWTKAHCIIWQGGQKPTSLKKKV